jgi:[ribosomal protein S5]-alanine N-acetyltransferase
MPTRLITVADAEALADLLTRNREFLAPYEPERPTDYLTVGGQRRVIGDILLRHAEGAAEPHVILDGDGRIAGRVTLTAIVRGPLRSCTLGYWVDADRGSRGLATAAVADIARVAFGALGLHRIEAGTLVDNTRSQRVLEKNGFRRFGLAPRYLHIAGDWRDHVMYQLLADQDPTDQHSVEQDRLGG